MFARTLIDPSKRGYIFFRLDWELNVDWMFRYDVGIWVLPLTPYYVEDSEGNPIVYNVVDNS